jgi:hypothetical protein
LTTADGCVEKRLTTVEVFIFDNNDAAGNHNAREMWQPSWIATSLNSPLWVELAREFGRPRQQPATPRFGRETIV